MGGPGPGNEAGLSVRHREAPRHLRSQVFTTAAALKVSALALGAAVAGPLADVSASTCLAAAALVYAALSAGPYLSCTPGRLRA